MFWMVVITLARCIFWGVVTQKVISNKGYYKNWFWLGFFFGVIVFIIALAMPEQRSYANDIMNNPLLRLREEEVEEDKKKKESQWKCSSCGRMNQGYTGTCASDQSKEGAPKGEQAKNVSRMPSEAQLLYASDTELLQMERLKKLKELLDLGAISEEEYEKKKLEYLVAK